jgi:hypothetical protein
MKDVIKLEAQLQLAIDLVQEVNLRFKELELGYHSIFRQVQARISRKRLNRIAVDASVTPRPNGGHRQCPFF